MKLSNFSKNILRGQVSFLLFTILMSFLVLFACIYSVYTVSENGLRFEISFTLLIGMKCLSFIIFLILALFVFYLSKSNNSFVGIVIFWTFFYIVLLIIIYLPFSFLWKKLFSRDGFARFVQLFAFVLTGLNFVHFIIHCVFVISLLFKRNKSSS